MAKAQYVDGFVLPIPKKNVAAYRKMAREGAAVWKRFGALEYFECVGEDLAAKATGGMKPRSFREMAKAKGNETVWFSFITYKSRAHRDLVNKKVMAYFGKKYAKEKDMAMPFDMRKMAYGGFKVSVSA
jgi:uncharacterized protein YbaA (DUF1428 family)